VLRSIGRQVKEVMEANPNLCNVHLDWTERTPIQRLVFDQDRLRLIGLTPQEAGQQLATILNGVPATSSVVGARRGPERLLGAPLAQRPSHASPGD
jgi:multidrug efflux pump subunit AcrB